MNVYLDIDGVLLINEHQASPYADDFLQYIVNTYPETTYWLTTHCWHGKNRTAEVLRPSLATETMKLLEKVKPTDWGDYKTDAIDYTKPFLWFDDDLFDEEREDLIKHNTLDNWIEIDLRKNPDQLKNFLTSFPLPV